MIVVKGPDGALIQFPDGTDTATMEGALQQHYPAPPQGDGKGGFADFQAMAANGDFNPKPDVTSDLANQSLKGIAQGIGGIASLPSNVGNFLGSKARYGIDRLTGMSPEASNADVAKVGQNIQGQIDTQLGGYDPRKFGDYMGDATGIRAAQTTPEKYANTIGQFIPGALLGPGNVTAKLVGAVTGGASSEAAGQATKGTRIEPYARMGAAIIGGGLGNAAADTATSPIIAGQTRASTSMLRNAIPEDQAAFENLGPNARLLDASPSMTGLAQGVAQQPSVAKNKLFEALTQDEAGRSNRLISGTEDVLGPYQSPALNETAVRDALKSENGPLYDVAKANAPEIDPVTKMQILNDANGLTKGVVSSDLSTMNGHLGDLRDALAKNDPSLTAEALHRLRMKLDKLGNPDQGAPSIDKANAGLAQSMRGIVDNTLKTYVPGFAEADANHAAAMRALEDRQYGYNALGGGNMPISPEQFTNEIQGKSLPEIQQGMNANIRDAMGTSSNDFSALKNRVGGPNAYNREKLNQAYGSDVSGKLGTMIDSEKLMSANRNKIMAGSNTASNQSAERLVNTPEMGDIPPNITMLGLGAKAAEKAVRSVVNNVMMRSSQSTRDALVEALMKQGPEAKAMMQNIMAAQPETQSKLLRALVGTSSGMRSIEGPSQSQSR